MYHIKIPTLLMLTTIAVITAMHGLYGQTQQHIDSVNAIVIQGSAKTPQQLEDLLLQNIEDAQTIHYQKGIADGYAKLSLLQYYNGRYEDNVTNMLQAIKIYEGLQLFENVSKSYGELGYQMKRRDFQKGARYMQKAINLAEKNDFHSILKDLYNNYGVLKEMEEQLDSALYYYESSLQLKQQEGDTFGIPYSISNIAGVYRLKNEFDKALENANLALDKRIALNDSIGLAENYTQLAEIFLAQNRLDSAVIYFDKSVLISKRKEYPFLTQYNYQQLADVFKRKNNATKALQYFEAYTKIKDSIQAVSVSEKVANLEIEFETEKKENEILQQRAQLAEKDLEVRRKNTLVYGGFGLALLLGLLGYLFYSQQKLKNRQLQKEAQLQTALSKIETQNKLQEQRLRISRDLHDNIGSQLTFVTSSIDN
ncbi:tetratricopeptide repeat protein, partial [Marinirhabdus gelatinilytica]|uniref:tetratricopeptide repeat protein n=1 Tax=Marinirhabdus gelatinilytica TaxID=1703343 RepID=UPI0014743E46